jgi:hypothetical protein
MDCPLSNGVTKFPVDDQGIAGSRLIVKKLNTAGFIFFSIKFDMRNKPAKYIYPWPGRSTGVEQPTKRQNSESKCPCLLKMLR